MKNGGPAYPCRISDTLATAGMSLRDYFAAAAMNGICSGNVRSEATNRKIAAAAYAMADTMLAERGK